LLAQFYHRCPAINLMEKARAEFKVDAMEDVEQTTDQFGIKQIVACGLVLGLPLKLRPFGNSVPAGSC